MAMMDMDNSCRHSAALTAQVGRLGPRLGGHLALSLHLWNELANSRSLRQYRKH